ncbi:MAG: hypothetical protein M1831_005973 [Alyxoria varia]|nr:MAG: hypothetical protein M1831_005973 [Alyxoria varia]
MDIQSSGGGPAEDNVTGFLVRSLSTNWSKGSVLAVDAGSHLAAITRLLEKYYPRYTQDTQATREDYSNLPGLNGSKRHVVVEGDPESSPTHSSDDSETSQNSSAERTPIMTTVETGPFASLRFPHLTARANALQFVRDYVATYLITHPHLDHLSGFAMNTAAFHNTSRPKKLAALPSTVNAIKTHIFNDVIWPNLTDEDGGVGFVTFQRLTEGGNLAVGSGAGKGYIEVCDGLCVKGMKISHGHCARSSPNTILQRGSEVGLSEATMLKPGGNNSYDGTEARRRTPSIPSMTQLPSASGTPGTGHAAAGTTQTEPTSREYIVDSTAYFIRDDASGREVLMFGDVEPDALSLSPRTQAVWNEAAPKIVAGVLRAVVIECSYDDSQGDAVLFGHLAPRHLIRELVSLAEKVKARKTENRQRRSSRKRKRDSGDMGVKGEEGVASGSSPLATSTSNNTNTTSIPLQDEVSPSANASAMNAPIRRGRRPFRSSSLSKYQSVDDADLSDDSPRNPRNRTPEEPEMSPRARGSTGGRPSQRLHSTATNASDDPATTSSLNQLQLNRTSTDISVPDAQCQTPRASASSAVSGTPASAAAAAAPPLAGLTVIVMHVKDTLRDGMTVGERILRQLREHDARLARESPENVGLGCEFVVSEEGGSYVF